MLRSHLLVFTICFCIQLIQVSFVNGNEIIDICQRKVHVPLTEKYSNDGSQKYAIFRKIEDLVGKTIFDTRMDDYRKIFQFNENSTVDIFPHADIDICNSIE